MYCCRWVLVFGFGLKRDSNVGGFWLLAFRFVYMVCALCKIELGREAYHCIRKKKGAK